MTHGSPKDSPQQPDEPDIEALIEAIRKPGETDAQLWARMGAAQNYLRRWGVHEPDQPDEPVDPVARMNAEDERQQLEVFSLDRELDQQQDRLDREEAAEGMMGAIRDPRRSAAGNRGRISLADAARRLGSSSIRSAFR